MKKFLFLMAFLFVGSFVFAMPSQAHAAPSFFSNFRLPNAAKIRVDSEFINNNQILNLYFSNLFFAKKINYELTYSHTEGEEAVKGEIRPSGKLVVKRSFTLGTCSEEGTCVYHADIDDMKLKITTQYSLFEKTETKVYNVN